jgi:hypothetical protein
MCFATIQLSARTRRSLHLFEKEALLPKLFVYQEGTGTNLSDLFTKTMAASKRDDLLDKFTY